MDFLSLDHFLLHPWSCANYSPASVESMNLRPHLNAQGIHMWNFLEQLLLMIMVGGWYTLGPISQRLLLNCGKIRFAVIMIPTMFSGHKFTCHEISAVKWYAIPWLDLIIGFHVWDRTFIRLGWWSHEALTHWGWDKMAVILQMTFWNGFSWMKIYEFRLKFDLSLFLGSS